MKRIISLFLLAGFFLALAPVYAEQGYANTNNTNTPPILNRQDKPAKPAVVFDPVCVITAVDKRDNAIIAAVDTFSAAAKTALTTRRDALKAAWALTDRKARRDALKAAWKSYREALDKARKDLRNAKNSAWKIWNTDRRACKGAPNDEPGAGSGSDASL